MNRENKPIINSCNTCRSPIYLGEPVYSSQDSKGNSKTGGVYGGASHTPERSNTTYHGGTYAENTNWTHNQEVWTQCFRCYDEWQEELRLKTEWDKKHGMWMFISIIPCILISTLIAWLIYKENTQLFKTYALYYGIGALVVGLIIGSIINHLKNGSAPKVDRYRIRVRK